MQGSSTGEGCRGVAQEKGAGEQHRRRVQGGSTGEGCRGVAQEKGAGE